MEIMAILPSNTTIDPRTIVGSNASAAPWESNIVNSNIKYQDTAISGQMLSVSYNMHESKYQEKVEVYGEKKAKDEIKFELCKLMVEELFKSGKLDFSMQNDYLSQTITFRGRMFVTPDSQTRIVRQMLDK